MKKFLFFLISATISISAVAQTSVKPVLELEKGAVYTIRNITKQKIQQSAQGQQINLDVTSNRVFRCKVLSLNNNNYEMEFSFDTIATKISSPVFNRESNSAKPGKEPAEILLNKLSKTRLKINVSKSGKLVGFIDYPAFKEKILLAIDSMPAGKKDEAIKQAEAITKESAIRSMIEPVFAYLPEKEIKIGDNWETSYISTSNDISTIVMNSFKLDDIKNGELIVSGISELESMPSTNPNAQMSQQLKGKSTFSGIINQSNGIALSMKEKSSIDGATVVKNNGEEMRIPLKIESESETLISK
jgi:hypothetical protein